MFNKKLILMSFLAIFLSGCLKKKTTDSAKQAKYSDVKKSGETLPEGGTYIFSSDSEEFSLDEDSDNLFDGDDSAFNDVDDLNFDDITADNDACNVVQFDFDDTAIKPSENKKINENIDLAKQNLKKDPNCKVVVKGYSCKIAKSDLYNCAISQERAENVAKAYEKGGLPREKLSAVGFGSAELLTDEDGIAAQAPNRRVETGFIID